MVFSEAHYIILCNSMLKICSSSIIVLIAYKIFTKIAKNLLTKRCTHCILNKSVARATKWNLSSAGRASALQAEGHRFEPYRFHSNFGWSYGEIAQLARACGSYPQCRGFESPSRYDWNASEKSGAFLFYQFTRSFLVTDSMLA